MLSYYATALSIVLVVATAANCNMKISNTLSSSAILLCGRENGGTPGARFTQLVAPGADYTYACPETTATTSYELYFAVRNDTVCTWDSGCNPNTGSCKSYPWVIGEGLSWQNGLWYGFVAANFDGAGLGFSGNYGSRSVQYGVQMKCSSYGTSPWTGTCDVDSSTNEPVCNPNTPSYGKPDSGVVACGPANNQGTIEVSIFESK
ncbi:Hypothetical protein, putative [Bodo saltans]|uniref:Membrane-associated protein n=1 Tax=Bodo saltans TaxID=75058 RepID=A0A0S4J7A4_BODSA|nr:Hypothetical protein, putative [Bodo saltans]|eukprot:CUG85886.1 Hypothetical protein, putative [Bodo saltans]